MKIHVGLFILAALITLASCEMRDRSEDGQQKQNCSSCTTRSCK